MSWACLPVLDPVTCCLQDRPGIGLVTDKPSVLATWSLEPMLLSKVCLSPPCFVTTDPPEPTRLPTSALRRGWGVRHSKFWTTWAKVVSTPLSSLPTLGQHRLAGVQGSHGVARTLTRVRGLDQQSIDPSFLNAPSRGRHSWHTGGSPSVPSLLEAVSQQLITDCVAFTSRFTPL